jgi:Flp pilus assembly protein TadD
MEKLSSQLNDLMQGEQWHDALSLAEGNIDAVCEDFDLSWNLGWVLVKLERYHDALPHFERAEALDVASPIAPWARGVALCELERLDEAEEPLLRALELKDSHLPLQTLTLVYLKAGRKADAERIHVEGLAKKRTRERLENYAAFLGDSGRDDEERAALSEAESAPVEGRSLNGRTHR